MDNALKRTLDLGDELKKYGIDLSWILQISSEDSDYGYMEVSVYTELMKKSKI